MNILFGYAISFGAKRHKENFVQTFSAVNFVEAVSHDEAIGKAVAMAQESYPRNDNYTDRWGIAVGVSFSPDFINWKLAQNEAVNDKA